LSAREYDDFARIAGRLAKMRLDVGVLRTGNGRRTSGTASSLNWTSPGTVVGEDPRIPRDAAEQRRPQKMGRSRRSRSTARRGAAMVLNPREEALSECRPVRFFVPCADQEDGGEGYETSERAVTECPDTYGVGACDPQEER
jgi:hypothetical protein